MSSNQQARLCGRSFASDPHCGVIRSFKDWSGCLHSWPVPVSRVDGEREEGWSSRQLDNLDDHKVAGSSARSLREEEICLLLWGGL